jgi:hypothetical protein
MLSDHTAQKFYFFDLNLGGLQSSTILQPAMIPLKPNHSFDIMNALSMKYLYVNQRKPLIAIGKTTYAVLSGFTILNR